MLNLTNEEDRHYGYLKEYLSHTTHFLKYSFDSASCSFYHQNIELSTFDEVTSSHYDLNQKNRNEFRWDIYHLTPIFAGNSFTSNILFDPQQFGLSTDLSTQINIFTIEKPLEQDLIKFYSPISELMVFEVSGVNHSFLVEDDLHLYNLNIRKLNITKERLDSEYIINNNFYYMHEINKYIDYDKYTRFLGKEKVELRLNKKYNDFLALYELSENDNLALYETMSKMLSTKLKIINKDKISITEIDYDTLTEDVKYLYDLYS